MPVEPAAGAGRLLAQLYSAFLDRVTVEITGQLRAGGISSVLMKGAAFARLLYDDSPERVYTDSDLLISQDDRDRAEAVLTELGFVRIDRDEDWLVPEPKYAHTFRRPSDTAVVDLHWRLSGATAPSTAIWSAVRRHITSVDLAGHPIDVLDPSASALLVGLHNAHHGTGRPSSLSDLDRAAQLLGPAVWREASRLAVEIGAEEAFAAGLRLTPAGDRVADELGLERRLSVEMWLKTNPSSYGAFVMDCLLRTTTLRGRLAVCMRVAVPPKVVMYRFSALARHGTAGLAFAYLFRPLRLVYHAFPTARDWLRARRELRAAGREQRRHPRAPEQESAQEQVG